MESNLFGVAEISANSCRCGGLLPRIEKRDAGAAYIPVVSGDEHQIVMQSGGRQEPVNNRHRPALSGGSSRQRTPSLRNPVVDDQNPLVKPETQVRRKPRLKSTSPLAWVELLDAVSDFPESEYAEKE